LAALHGDLVLLKEFSDWGKRVNAEKVAALLAGKADGYPSESERDLALAGYLLRWAGGDAERADRVFRLTGCYREKWERADYRERTFAKALESVPPATQPESHPATLVSEPQPAPADALPQVAPDVLDRIARLHPTDAGNAEAFALLFGGQVRFEHKQKRWLVWGQHRWLPDADALVDRLALQTVRVRYQAAATIPHDEQRRSAVKWALDSESHRRRQDLLASAENSLPTCAHEAKQTAARRCS
jgi:putative DNA primase/helicase